MTGTMGPAPPGEPEDPAAREGSAPAGGVDPWPLLPVHGSEPALRGWLEELLCHARTAAYACRSAAEHVCDDGLGRGLRELSAAREAQVRVLDAIVSSLGGEPGELERAQRAAVRQRLEWAVPGGDAEVVVALRLQLEGLDAHWSRQAPEPLPHRVARLLEELSAATARHAATLERISARTSRRGARAQDGLRA